MPRLTDSEAPRNIPATAAAASMSPPDARTSWRNGHPDKRIAPNPTIAIARNAQEILSLNHQYGEGWLIAGEISSFMKNGISNVLCLQPFGCIANHIVAKGAEKKLREIHPQLNLLFLDADAGISEVNFFNRLHFFLNHAKETGRVRQGA